MNHTPHSPADRPAPPTATHACCSGHRDAPKADDGRVLDPVCGMRVDPATTPHHAEHAGQTRQGVELAELGRSQSDRKMLAYSYIC